MDRLSFLKEGGYPEGDGKYGTYHYYVVRNLCQKYAWKKLSQIKIVHQYHNLLRGEEIPPGHYSEQFKIMHCRKT
jgi:hypothetical protein